MKIKNPPKKLKTIKKTIHEQMNSAQGGNTTNAQLNKLKGGKPMEQVTQDHFIFKCLGAIKIRKGGFSMAIGLKLKLSIKLQRFSEIVRNLPRKAIEFLKTLLDRWGILLHP